MFENFCLRIEGAVAAHEDAQVVFGQAALESSAPELRAARPQVDFHRVHGAGPRHYGVGGSAEFQKVLVVALTPKRSNVAIGRGDFAIRCHGHVHQYKGKV